MAHERSWTRSFVGKSGGSPLMCLGSHFTTTSFLRPVSQWTAPCRCGRYVGLRHLVENCGYAPCIADSDDKSSFWWSSAAVYAPLGLHLVGSSPLARAAFGVTLPPWQWFSCSPEFFLGFPFLPRRLDPALVPLAAAFPCRGVTGKFFEAASARR